MKCFSAHPGIIVACAELLLCPSGILVAGECVINGASKGVELEVRFDESYETAGKVNVRLTIRNQSDKRFIPDGESGMEGSLIPQYARKRSVWVPSIGWEDSVIVSLTAPDGTQVEVWKLEGKSHSRHELKPSEAMTYDLEIDRIAKLRQPGEYQCSLSFLVHDASSRVLPSKSFSIPVPDFRFHVKSGISDGRLAGESNHGGASSRVRWLAALAGCLIALVISGWMLRAIRRNRPIP